MRELWVLLNGEPVGCLTETRRGARFPYNEKMNETHQGSLVLSTSLPVKTRAYGEGLTNAWFEGLLPEGERLEALSREVGCAQSDYVGLLSEVGWECAGAVSIVDPARAYSTSESIQSLSQAELAQELLSLPTYPLIDGSVIRVSLGGYQEKLCVVVTDIKIQNGYVAAASFALPNAAAISTHILKPQPDHRFTGLIAAEAWAMTVASAAARCARVWLLEMEQAPLTLMVERFDRVWIKGEQQRVHQEDCCQALGLPPEKKYAGIQEARGDDPSYLGIAKLLKKYAANPEHEITELFRQMVVNLAIGNTDAHAKNYAFLYKKIGAPEMSPLYDVVPVVDIEPKAQYLSMRIGNEIEAAKVTREHLIVEGTAWGMPPQDVNSLLDNTLSNLEQGIEKATEIYPDAGAIYSDSVRARIDRLR